MGVINVTPDSFSDGGRYHTVDAALRRAEALAEAGADILDVGGESTRPRGPEYGDGAAAVSVNEELKRVLPVVRRLAAECGLEVSVDTRKPEVAEACLAEGASWINDVTALRAPQMAAVVSAADCGVVLMHMRGTPETTASLGTFTDVVAEVRSELGEALERAVRAGVAPARIALDPGLGFGKSPAQDLALLRALPSLLALGRPLWVGPSRKRFVGAALDGAPVQARLHGTSAAVAASVLGGASFVRVHDVAEMAQVARVARAIRDGEVAA